MTRPSYTLDLHRQGESITFFTDTPAGAMRTEGEVRMAPAATGPTPHLHVRQREIFRVVSGRLQLTVDGVVTMLEQDQEAVVEPGQRHTFANGSATEPVVASVAVEPSLYFEWFLSEMARSAIRNGGHWDDVPLLEASYVLHLMRNEYRLAEIPAVLHVPLFFTLSRIALLLGRHRVIAPMTRRPETPA